MDSAAVYKKKIRRQVMKISISLISFYVVYFIAVVASIIIYMIASGLMAELLNSSGAGTAEIIDGVSMGWLSIVALFVGSFMMLIVRGKRLYTQDLTKTSSKIHIPDFFKMTAIILGINAVVTLIGYIFVLFLESRGFSMSSEDPITTNMMDFSGLLYVVILGPILEEIIFRGAILRSLEQFGQNFAIVVSSLAFGLYHLMLFQGVFAFFIGFVLGYCAIRFSIKWSMLLHMINNGFAMALAYINAGTLIEICVLLLMLVLGVTSLLIGFKKIKLQLRTGKPTDLYFVSGIPIVPYYLSPTDPRIAPYIGHAMSIKAKPYRLAFSSAWLIIALTLASLFTLLGTFVL